MKALPPFGKGSSADESGYNLPVLIGWLEDHIEHESEQCRSKDLRTRLEQAQDARQLLEEVSEWTPLLTKAYKDPRTVKRERDELLEALKGMLEWARRVQTKNPGMEVAQAVSAIARAEGGEA